MRTKNTLLNAIMGIASQLVLVAFGFVTRYIFIKQLGLALQGVTATLTSIISMLGLAELGIGTAIICSLYKPIKEEKWGEVAGLLRLFSRIYRVIAVVVLTLGMLALPFLKMLTSASIETHYLVCGYLLLLFDTVVSYLFAHKRTVLTANQKNYIVLLVHGAVGALMNLLQIVILIRSQNYLVFLAVRLGCRLLENSIINLYVNRKYRFLLEAPPTPVSAEIKTEITANTKALALHYVGIYLINGTDMLIISAYLGALCAGIYSNYLLILDVIKDILLQVAASPLASFGNLLAGEKEEHLDVVFSKVMLAVFLLCNFSAVSLYVLLNPFIVLWIGSEGLLQSEVVLMLVVNFYIVVISAPLGNLRAGAGLFRPDRYLHLLLAALNLTISILLVQVIGIIGVFIGTFLCLMIKEIFVLPRIVYQHIFKKSVKIYYWQMGKYVLISLVSGVLTIAGCIVTQYFPPILAFGWCILMCVIVPNVVAWIILRKTAQFQELLQLGWRLFK